jgi:hypothetical protein
VAILKANTSLWSAATPVQRGTLWKHLAVILACTATLKAGPPEQVDEYQVKAAFVYNFAKFVEWPPAAFKSAQDPIVICVLGSNSFKSALEEVIKGKAVEGRTFVVRPVSKSQLPCPCHILFVKASERKAFRAMVGDLKGAGVLTVGETPGFDTDAAIINFKVENGRIRFEINAKAAEQEKLHISSKLLSLAQIVMK